MAVNTWKQKDLRVIMKGKRGKPGEGGNVTITNAEIEDILDGMTDDHRPGNKQGAKADVPDEVKDDKGKPGGEIDKNSKKVGDEVKEGADKGQEEGSQQQGQTNKGPAKNSEKPGQRGRGGNNKVDYSHIRPQFNWKQIVNKFIVSAIPKTQETYTKPSRKSVTGAHIAAQMGAAAIRPGEKIGEAVDLKLCFCLDCSGSMLSSVARMFAEATKLLTDPRFSKSEVFVIKFSDSHEMYRGIFAKNKAHRVKNAAEKSAGKYETTMQQVFANAEGGGTEISQASYEDTLVLLKRGYNVLLLTDTDILWDHNIKLVLQLIKAHSRQMFVVMRDRDCYLKWRQATGIATPQITHF